jgi:hypothetical protein
MDSLTADSAPADRLAAQGFLAFMAVVAWVPVAIALAAAP